MGAIVQLEVERSVLAAKEVDFWRDKRGRCGWADRGEEVEEVEEERREGGWREGCGDGQHFAESKFDEATLTSSHDIPFFKGIIRGGSPQSEGLRQLFHYLCCRGIALNKDRLGLQCITPVVGHLKYPLEQQVLHECEPEGR